MAFKISLVSDVRGWLKGTADVERSLDDVADSLDDLARDTRQNADKAADTLEREFSDAFDKVKTESKTASKKVGRDWQDGADEASEGTETLKENAESNAKEIAASFDGSIDSIADGFQGLIAEAFEGWGPAGLVAGAAVAAGIGLAVSSLQEAADKAAESKERVLELSDALAEAGGNPELLDWLTILRDRMNEIVDNKEWYEFWQQEPSTYWDKLSDGAKKYGLNIADLLRAQKGDAEALARVNEELARQQDEANRKVEQSRGTMDANRSSYEKAAGELSTFTDEVNRGAAELSRAEEYQRAYAEAFGDTETAAQRSAEAAKTFSDSLTDNLSVADEGLDRFVKKGKLKINEWTRELQERAGQNTRIKDFMVDVETKLSPEARENFAKLPTETQDQIAQAFDEGTAKQRKQIIKNLEAEAKVEKVNVDLSGAQTSVNSKPITVPTNVDTSGAIRGAQSAAAAAQKAVSAEASHVELKTKVNDQGALKGAQKAADDAQRIANQERNKIEYKTKVNDDALQGEVNRAAARINPPTIWVNVKAKKDTP